MLEMGRTCSTGQGTRRRMLMTMTLIQWLFMGPEQAMEEHEIREIR